jgi:hypothetical protein
MTTIVVFAPLLILGSALVFAALAAADLQDTARPRRLAGRRSQAVEPRQLELPRAA